jgi:hypothetical protein
VTASYVPTRLAAADYPGVVPQDQAVDTIAVGAVLAAANLQQGTERYRNLVNFVDAFFTGFQSLLDPGRHPKWHEVNITAELPGWQRFPSVDAPFQARENVGVVVARGRMLSSVRPLMRQEDSRRPVWEFADRVQITHSVLEAQWKALVVPAPSRRLLRHTLLPLALTSSRSWSAYAAAAGVL